MAMVEQGRHDPHTKAGQGEVEQPHRKSVNGGGGKGEKRSMGRNKEMEVEYKPMVVVAKAQEEA